MKRSQAEIDNMIARLYVGKDIMPEFNFFGDNNHKTIELQVDVLLNKIDEDELHDIYEDQNISDSEYYGALDAFAWINLDSDELADADWIINEKKQRKNTCKECPFRKNSIPGYLGEASNEPENFLQTIQHNPIPCHMQVNWEKETDLIQKGFTNTCVGSLKFLRNNLTIPREKRYADLSICVEKDDSVFDSKNSFIKHHS